MLIQGKLIKVSSIDYKAPIDGVHRSNSKGFLRHPKMRLLNGKFLYKGDNGFYYRISEDRGIKVFFSIAKKVAKDRNHVERVFCEMNKHKGVLVGVHSIVDVEINFRTMKDPIIGTAFGIEVDHVHYPDGAWSLFCTGYPYNFDCIEHPDHSAEGFLDYQKSIIDTFPGKYTKACSFGNMAWCTKKNKWIGMDLE